MNESGVLRTEEDSFKARYAYGESVQPQQEYVVGKGLTRLALGGREADGEIVLEAKERVPIVFWFHGSCCGEMHGPFSMVYIDGVLSKVKVTKIYVQPEGPRRPSVEGAFAFVFDISDNPIEHGVPIGVVPMPLGEGSVYQFRRGLLSYQPITP